MIWPMMLDIKYLWSLPVAGSRLSYVWQMWKRPWVLKSVIKYSFLKVLLIAITVQSIGLLLLETEICIFGRKRNNILPPCGDFLVLFKRKRYFGGAKREASVWELQDGVISISYDSGSLTTGLHPDRGSEWGLVFSVYSVVHNF